MSKTEDNSFNAKELQSQEDNGWNVSWDPGRLWVTQFEEEEKSVKIRGEAMAHEDVTEFYRRWSHRFISMMSFQMFRNSRLTGHGTAIR